MKILFLSLLAIFCISGIWAQADTSYVTLIDTTIQGKPFFKVESVSTGTNGSMKLERTAPIDSSELVTALINGAKEAKLNLRGPIRALTQEPTWNRSFNTNSQLLQQITGASYFDLNTRFNKQTFLNLPEKDTSTTKVIAGTTYTSWIVWVGNVSTVCRVNEDGIFVQIATQNNFTVSPDATNAKRGRMLLYDQDFARFSGTGDFPLLTGGAVDIVKIGGVADETGRVVRELWMSRDRQVRVLKNLPK
jgi:hypothetical protein